MVRLIVRAVLDIMDYAQRFNSKDGAIDRAIGHTPGSPRFFVSIPKMVRLIAGGVLMSDGYLKTFQFQRWCD